MRIIRLAFAASVVASGFAIAGCGESAPPVTQEALTKPGDTSKFSGMLEDMKNNVKASKAGKSVVK